MTAPSWSGAPVAPEAMGVFAGGSLIAALEELRPWLIGVQDLAACSDEVLDRRLLLLVTILGLPIEGDPRRVVEPGDTELWLLRIVKHYRDEGLSWPMELQRIALLADRQLRHLAVVRSRYRDACVVLGIPFTEAAQQVAGSSMWRRRWWWPAEVPARPVWTRGSRYEPVGARPVIWLPYYDGPPDPVGLGAGWEPGQLLVLSAELVREAWGWRPTTPVERVPPEPALTESATVDEDVDGSLVAEAARALADETVRGIEEFLGGRALWRRLEPPE